MKSIYVCVRFRDSKLVKLIDMVATQRGEDRSSFIRRSVFEALARLSYLSEAEKKALGIESKSLEIGNQSRQTDSL